MQPVSHLASRLTRAIRLLRWVIPLAFSVVGFGYTIWESLIGDGYSLFSPQVLVGFGLVGVLCPLLTFATLTWAERAAVASEQAKRAVEQQYLQQAALNVISKAVNQSLELDTVLNRSLDHILEAMQLEFGEVRLLENDCLVLHASRGVSTDFLERERRIRIGQCICGESAARGEVTVKRKVQDILEKMGVANRAQAVADAARRGLL